VEWSIKWTKTSWGDLGDAGRRMAFRRDDDDDRSATAALLGGVNPIRQVGM
jgi:hypothetical protein